MTEPTKEGAPASGRKSFSVVARMVLALKRFECELQGWRARAGRRRLPRV